MRGHIPDQWADASSAAEIMPEPVEGMERILVALDRGGSREVLTRAVGLARLFGARLELFLCDAEHAYAERHQYEPSGVALAHEAALADSRRYLESLWCSLAVHDVPVSIDVACETPLYEGIVRKVRRSRPDLLVRGVGGEGVPRLAASDWDLISGCPVPLLLIKGAMWRPAPVVAAAVDLSPEESPALTREILRIAQQFADIGHGALEVLHAGPFQNAPGLFAAQRSILEQRAEEAGVAPSTLHLIDGEPAVALTEFAAGHRYELVVLGALTHRKSLTSLVGTLTSRLIDAIDSDFLLVKPRSGSFSR